MDSIITLVIYFLFGTIIVVGLGVYLQLKQQHKEKNKSND